MRFSTELDRAAVQGHELPGAPGAIPNIFSNLYIEDLSTRQVEAITRAEDAEEISNPFALEGIFRGASADVGVVTYEASANLTPEASGENEKLYVYDHGSVGLAGILPSGSIPAGGSSDVRKPFSEIHDTVSSDGSRILFKSPVDGTSASQLYMRKNGNSTVWVSQSEASASNPEPQNVEFQAAAPDDTKILFTTTDSLVNSDPGGTGYGLYLYSDSADPQNESNLTYIARISEARGERVFGRGGPVWGMSDDARRIYFESPGPEPGLPEESGLYLWESGEIRRVGGLVNGGFEPEEPDVSSDGRFLTFFSEEPYTAQGIHGSALYLYDAVSGSITCVSCKPNGSVSTSTVEESPAATTAGIGFGTPYLRRFLSSDGRFVFFTTADALVPQDTNKLPDVYEYNVGTHETAMLSSGTGDTGSWFAEASPSGDDVFILTRQALAGWDIDKLVDLYDVRVDGGFREPEQPQVPCDGDACQGTPTATPSFRSGSGFSGLGNSPAKSPSTIGPRSLTHAQLLARALKACKLKSKRERAACRKRARRKYAVKHLANSAFRRVGR
jgi:hypothetical protein